jgi:hypothetical protein
MNPVRQSESANPAIRRFPLARYFSVAALVVTSVLLGMVYGHRGAPQGQGAAQPAASLIPLG